MLWITDKTTSCHVHEMDIYIFTTFYPEKPNWPWKVFGCVEMFVNTFSLNCQKWTELFKKVDQNRAMHSGLRVLTADVTPWSRLRWFPSLKREKVYTWRKCVSAQFYSSQSEQNIFGTQYTIPCVSSLVVVRSSDNLRFRQHVEILQHSTTCNIQQLSSLLGC